MVSDNEAIFVEEVSFAGSGAALEDDVVNDPRLIEQPEAASAIRAIVIGARRRDAPDQKSATPIAIDTNNSRSQRLLVARHAAKYSRPKQNADPKARVG